MGRLRSFSISIFFFFFFTNSPAVSEREGGGRKILVSPTVGVASKKTVHSLVASVKDTVRSVWWFPPFAQSFGGCVELRGRLRNGVMCCTEIANISPSV